MEGAKRQWIPKGLIGGLAGLLLVGLCRGVLFEGGYSMPAFCRPLIDQVGLPWAAAVTCALFFGLGAAAGIATLPFADSGRELVAQSLAHFAATAALWSLALGVCFGVRRTTAWLLGLLGLAALYFLIWLGRWVGWYAEVAAIREKLGLAPGPSLFHWRETLPYVGFALLLCLVFQTAVRLCDDRVPILSAVYGMALLPIGAFCAGMSLGQRHGLCPLYPAACGVFTAVFVLTAKLYTNIADEILIPIALIAALAGNAAGAARHKIAKKKADARYNQHT